MAVESPVLLHPGTAIVLPETDNKGTVVEIADGTNLRVNDVIMFVKDPVIEVEKDEITHRIVRESDVLGWYSVAPQPEPIPPTE